MLVKPLHILITPKEHTTLNNRMDNNTPRIVFQATNKLENSVFLRRYPILLLLVSLISGCSTVPAPLPAEGGTPNRIQAKQRVSEARKSVAEARRLRGLWRDTEAHLSKAETSLTDGEYQLAVKQAELALAEAHLAINQTYLERAKFGLRQFNSSEHDYNSKQDGLI